MKVLMASDGSPASLRAAAFLGDLARRDPEIQVTILYVADIAREIGSLSSLERFVDVPLDVMIQRSAQPVIEETRKALNLPAERVAAEVQVGNPAEEIVEMVGSGSFAYVVMGSRGLSPIPQLLLGSVSERVIRLSHLPVLLVK